MTRSPSEAAAPFVPVERDRSTRVALGPADDEPVGPLRAALRRPLLVLLPVLLVLMPALAWAVTTPETYRAQSEILVGRVDVEANAVPGFVSAVQQLAGTYARLVNSSDVAGPAAKELGLPLDEVRGSLTATNVPESSIISVEATAGDQAKALALVQAASNSLISYVAQQSTPTSAEDKTLADYRASALELNLARSRVTTAQTARDSAIEDGTTAEEQAAERALAEAQADAAAALLRVETLANVFESNQRGGTERNSLRAINEPQGLGSDRRSRLQLAVGVSLVLGLALGIAAASLRANFPALRAARQRARARRTTATT